MIYGSLGGTVYVQKKDLKFVDLTGNYFYWSSLTSPIHEILEPSSIKWTSPNVLVEWDDDL